MAILVGLAGTLIILQPSLVIFGWPAALPLASAVSMAIYMVMTRSYRALYTRIRCSSWEVWHR